MAETETERAPSTRRPRRPAPARRRSVHPDVVAAQARDMLTLLLFVRAANTLLQCTFFQPDEYYQALEPAWAMAFGRDSGAWLTWVRTASPVRTRPDYLPATSLPPYLPIYLGR